MGLTGRVPVTLNDGKKRSIRFDINALVDAEDRLGSLLKLQMDIGQASIRSVRGALCCGLGGDLTEVEVGDLMYGVELTDLMTAIMRALHEALEPQSAKDTPVPPPGADEARTATPSTT